MGSRRTRGDRKRGEKSIYRRKDQSLESFLPKKRRKNHTS